MRSRFLALALAAAAAPVALAAERNATLCLTKVGDAKELADKFAYKPATTAHRVSRRAHSNNTREISIEAYVHVLATPEEAEKSSKKGEKQFLLSLCRLAIPQTTVDEQMKVLNERFKPAHISFQLMATDWNVVKTLPKTGSVMTGIEYNKELKDLWKGDSTALNIYFLDAGYYTAGRAAHSFKKSVTRAVFLNTMTVPNSWHMSTNMGVTAVHEVSHWLGYDDHMALDEQGLDSCNSLPNEFKEECDPRPGCKNYMSYASDKCRVEFTPSQIEGMRSWAEKVHDEQRPFTHLETQYITFRDDVCGPHGTEIKDPNDKAAIECWKSFGPCWAKESKKRDWMEIQEKRLTQIRGCMGSTSTKTETSHSSPLA
ncbi:hypothetical protein QQS21_008310 [Conoideocrella luteorostrata]|uniref:Peptidase M43 pregnancy-associated plasma-A domain-containing protein n=1 Tax=Conoideocrella luteorostrata TaxID=1105319 RepID=A0AAJ0FWN0_9HYPO|nr:hypothetical protein QQS21_008310 [Conoideocrella luteorostrata]